MLDKLDGKSSDRDTLKEDKGSHGQIESKDTADSNNNNDAYAEKQIPTLANHPAAAASVAEFYQGLQRSSGLYLDKLHKGEINFGLESDDYVDLLEKLASEQNFRLQFLQVENLEGLEQSLVQIFSRGDSAVTVCLGQGEGSKNSAARCALMYIMTMSRPSM